MHRLFAVSFVLPFYDFLRSLYGRFFDLLAHKTVTVTKLFFPLSYQIYWMGWERMRGWVWLCVVLSGWQGWSINIIIERGWVCLVCGWAWLGVVVFDLAAVGWG